MRATSSVIVGRDSETALLERALGAAGRSSGRAVFLVGEAGIGKSRLAGRCAFDAYAREVPVLRGRATSTGLVVPYRPLMEALSSRFRAAGTPEEPELEPFRPALSALVPEWRRHGPRFPVSVVELAEALLRLLSVLGREHGCVMVLEDLHDSDTETIAVVEYVADNLADLPVLLLGTLRPEPGPALDVARAAAGRQTATVLELGLLDDTQVHRMAEACLDAAPGEVPAEAHRRIARRAGGNPYLVEVLLADLVDSGTLRRTDDGWRCEDGPEGAVPTGIVRSWAARLDRLDPPVRELLLTAATLGSTFQVPLLQTVLGYEERALFAHLRAATEAGVIAPDGAAPDRYAFRHALTAEALTAALLPAERAATARRAADALEELGPAMSEDARQLLATLHLAAGDAAAAGAHLAEAGRRMLGQGAAGSAAVLLERAHELIPDGRRPEVAASLAAALAEAGRLAEAFALAAGLPPVPPGTPAAAERADAHTRVAWAAVMGEHPEEAARRVRAARALLGPTPPPGQEAALAVVEGHLVLLSGGPGEDGAADAADAARRAAAVAEEHGLPVVACQAWQLLGLLSRNQGFDEADACLERMLEVSERHQLAAWRTEALVRLGANAFLRTGDATRLAAARTAAGELGALALTQTVDGLLAMNAVLCGEWEKARATVDRSVDAAARVRNLSAHRYLLLADATLAAHQGRRRERDAALLRFRRAGGEDSLLVPLQRGLCLAVGALLEEDRRGAREHLESAVAWERERPSLYFLGGRWGLLPLVRALDGTGDIADHREALASHGAQLAWNRLFLGMADAVHRGRGGDPAGAAEAVRSALRAGEVFPLARHLALRLVAEAAVADGWGEPVTWLRTAEEYFHAAGVQPVASACRAALRRAGASAPQRRDGRDRIPAPLRTSGVTPREYEVFVLLPDRPGNQQIARRLSISPRTVEKHMASLLAKTGRQDRTALCEFAAEWASDTVRR
ncbi:AAA family ATPase [Streptomyces albidoflavus]|uniref:helix-turn-helix transcriptional regulator n=1 Tax=Streptomyces albidoflavus TaxID=1886 RepID=UPI0033DEC0C7